MSPTPGAALVVPVKDFTKAKNRLAATLSERDRMALAERMATIVVRAGAPLPVYVVCDTAIVRNWAEGLDANVVWTPDLGLNGAVAVGVEHVAAAGMPRAIVSHADLPLARSYEWLAERDGVTIVPDRHLDGSNVVSVPSAAGFRFAYGAGSFQAHRREAARLGEVLHVVRDARLGWDVDLPADLDLPALPEEFTP